MARDAAPGKGTSSSSAHTLKHDCSAEKFPQLAAGTSARCEMLPILPHAKGCSYLRNDPARVPSTLYPGASLRIAKPVSNCPAFPGCIVTRLGSSAHEIAMSHLVNKSRGAKAARARTLGPCC